MLKTISHKFEWAFNFLLASIRTLFRLRKPAALITYRTYGDEHRVKVMARVVEGFTSPQFSVDQRWFGHFLRVVKLFSTVKIAGARVTAKLDGQQTQLLSNEEGFISSIVTVSHPKKDSSCDLTLDSSGEEEISHEYRKRSLEVHRPSDETQLLIISDIDDTILKSRATSFFRLALKTLFLPLSRRQAFPEVAGYYQRLRKGLRGGGDNLFFYVSSSTWNIYPLLDSFLKEHQFPTGPIILQDIASEKKNQEGHSHAHKFHRISEIAEFYPQYPLILIGDAGQKDAQIYLDVIKSFPGRVQMVLIRHSWWTSKVHTHTELVEEAERAGIVVHYFESLDEVSLDLGAPQ